MVTNLRVVDEAVATAVQPKGRSIRPEALALAVGDGGTEGRWEGAHLVVGDEHTVGATARAEFLLRGVGEKVREGGRASGGHGERAEGASE